MRTLKLKICKNFDTIFVLLMDKKSRISSGASCYYEIFQIMITCVDGGGVLYNIIKFNLKFSPLALSLSNQSASAPHKTTFKI